MPILKVYIVIPVIIFAKKKKNDAMLIQNAKDANLFLQLRLLVFGCPSIIDQAGSWLQTEKVEPKTMGLRYCNAISETKHVSMWKPQVHKKRPCLKPTSESSRAATREEPP